MHKEETRPDFDIAPPQVRADSRRREEKREEKGTRLLLSRYLEALFAAGHVGRRLWTPSYKDYL